MIQICFYDRSTKWPNHRYGLWKKTSENSSFLLFNITCIRGHASLTFGSVFSPHRLHRWTQMFCRVMRFFLHRYVSSLRRKRLVFSDNNFQDYEFTRLNTYKKKEMSEELPKIGSNNNYWIKLLLIIGNYCPKKQADCGEEKRHICVRKKA